MEAPLDGSVAVEPVYGSVCLFTACQLILQKALELNPQVLKYMYMIVILIIYMYISTNKLTNLQCMFTCNVTT